jgi:hypothetical protein
VARLLFSPPTSLEKWRKSNYVLLSGKGNPLKTQQIANRWNDLLSRVRKKHPSFRRLSFKYLRKTAAQLHQDLAGADSETIAVLEGRAQWSAHDAQANHYYRRCFGKVHAANQQLRNQLQPMFDAAPHAFGS